MIGRVGRLITRPQSAVAGNAFPSISNLVLRWKASTIAGVSEAGLLVASVADQSASGNDGTTDTRSSPKISAAISPRRTGSIDRGEELRVTTR